MGEAGWEVFLVPAFAEEKWGALTRKKYGEAGRCHPHFPERLRPRPGRPIVVLDGLLGLGAGGPLREPIVHFTRTINSLRHAVEARVFAVDLPTGLDGDSGAIDPDCVQADFTLAIGFAKAGLVADSAVDHVGRLAVLPLAALHSAAETRPGAAQAGSAATPEELRVLLPHRKFDSHKGDYGRIAILAGSPGFTGAAVMASAACVHAGAGLVTLYVPADLQPMLAALTPPEVMVAPVKSYAEVLQSKADVIALGPGVGRRHAEELLEIIRVRRVPDGRGCGWLEYRRDPHRDAERMRRGHGCSHRIRGKWRDSTRTL